MIGGLSAVIGMAIVALVALLMLSREARLTPTERIGLCLMTAGLVWAGPARFLGRSAGVADLVFLVGILASLIALRTRLTR